MREKEQKGNKEKQTGVWKQFTYLARDWLVRTLTGAAIILRFPTIRTINLNE